MDDRTFIQDLRSQAIDDNLGAVVCRPQARASDYLNLALRVASVPTAARGLIDAAMHALNAGAAERSYAAWRNLFDLADDAAQRKPVAPAVAAVLMNQLRVAVLDWRADQIDDVLKVLLNTGLWTETQPDPAHTLCTTARMMLDGLDRSDPSNRDEPAVLASVQALMSHMDAHRGWNARQRAVLACVRDLISPAGVQQANHALQSAFLLLCSLNGEQPAAEIILPVFRETLLASMEHPDGGGLILKAARALLAKLEAGDAYGPLYAWTVRLVAAGDDTDDDFDTKLKWLATCHPDGPAVDELLAKLSAFGKEAALAAGELQRRNAVLAWLKRSRSANADIVVPWRHIFLSCCLAASEAERKDLCRAWGLQRIRDVLAAKPDHIPTLARGLAELAGAPAPDLAEARSLLSFASGLASLDAAHVRALAELPILQPAAASALAWCATCDAVQPALRSPDRATWFRIAIDLVKSGQSWDAPAVTETVGRLRSFSQLLVMSNPGCVKEAGLIMEGLSGIVNGSLLSVCARNIPQGSPNALAELRAAGLGIELPDAAILALRQSGTNTSRKPTV